MFTWIFLSEFFHIDISNCRLHTFLKTEVMLKVQFGGLELFKNKGALFQDEFYLPRFFRPPLTNWWYIVQILMDGLALCVFFKAFVCWWNLTTWAASVAILLSLPNSTYFATYDWLGALMHLYCDEPQCMICVQLSCTCIGTSWLGCIQSKHGDVADLLRMTCHVYGRKFSTKSQCKPDRESVSLKRKVWRL